LAELISDAERGRLRKPLEERKRAPDEAGAFSKCLRREIMIKARDLAATSIDDEWPRQSQNL
jgi:hypothetical protein